MRVLLWIGNESNQKALANKIAQNFEVIGVVKETRNAKIKITFKKVIHKIFEKIFLSQIGKAWFGMKKYYEHKYPNYPATKTIDVENINSNEAYTFSKNLKPDLIIVSGTRLIKEKMLSIYSENGILNLHTGLSPYIKGGPNCTNWCIAENKFEFIGNTIMWIDLGIDTGNILTTEFTELNKDLNLLDLHIRVIEHAHDLYLKAIKYISENKKQSIKQSEIARGKTYYTKEWTFSKKIDMIRNFKKMKKTSTINDIVTKRKAIRVVSID